MAFGLAEGHAEDVAERGAFGVLFARGLEDVDGAVVMLRAEQEQAEALVAGGVAAVEQQAVLEVGESLFEVGIGVIHLAVGRLHLGFLEVKLAEQLIGLKAEWAVFDDVFELADGLVALVGDEEAAGEFVADVVERRVVGVLLEIEDGEVKGNGFLDLLREDEVIGGLRENLRVALPEFRGPAESGVHSLELRRLGGAVLFQPKPLLEFAELRPVFRGGAGGFRGAVEDLPGFLFLPVGGVKLIDGLERGEVFRREREGLLGVFDREVGLVEVLRVKLREIDAGQRLFRRGFDGVLEHLDGGRRVVPAREFVGHFDGEFGIAGIEVERLAITLQHLFLIRIFLGDKALRKGRERLRFFFVLRVQHEVWRGRADGRGKGVGKLRRTFRRRGDRSRKWRQLRGCGLCGRATDGRGGGGFLRGSLRRRRSRRGFFHRFCRRYCTGGRLAPLIRKQRRDGECAAVGERPTPFFNPGKAARIHAAHSRR